MGHPEIWGAAGRKLLVVALTGGIASGKSEVAKQLEYLGITVVDADEVAREITLPGTVALARIVEEFGTGVLAEDGTLDRAVLGELVFSNSEKLELLNGITHPAINAEIISRVNQRAEALAEGEVPAVVVDAALIVDIGAGGIFDMVLVVSADEELRVSRMVEHRAMKEEEARYRIASQVSDERRKAMADLVILNNGTLSELQNEVRDACAVITEKAFEAYP